MLQAQHAPALPYAKAVGRPTRHWKLPSTIARHENGYSSLNKIIVISCRNPVFTCQFHPCIHVSSFYLSFCVLKMKSRTSCKFLSYYTNYTIPCVGNSPVKGDFCYQRGILHGNTSANRDYWCRESKKSDTYIWRAQDVDWPILCRPCCAYLTP